MTTHHFKSWLFFSNKNFNSKENNLVHVTRCPLFCSFFSLFFALFLPRLSFKVVSLANFSSFFVFFCVFREFMVILFKICVHFMIILHGKENKVYGGREMDRKIDLSNFMYARLYDASKDMITNKILFLYSIHWFDQRMFYYFSHFS